MSCEKKCKEYKDILSQLELTIKDAPNNIATKIKNYCFPCIYNNQKGKGYRILIND